MSDKPTIEEYLKNIQEGVFRAYKCVDCGAVIAPPSGSCYGCGSNNMEWTDVSGKGKLVSFTVIHVAPDEFAEEAPYYVAIIELEEGTRVSARLLGYDPLKPEEVSLGIPVKIDFEKGKSGKTYLAFRPA
ncbi:MAG: Zn-ribbon domain-containing OB-fold protein [Candidatus Thorarchaeota archaeon]